MRNVNGSLVVIDMLHGEVSNNNYYGWFGGEMRIVFLQVEVNFLFLEQYACEVTAKGRDVYSWLYIV